MQEGHAQRQLTHMQGKGDVCRQRSISLLRVGINTKKTNQTKKNFCFPVSIFLCFGFM